MTTSVENQDKPAATLKTWLCEPLSHEVKLAVERLRRAEDVVHVAVMPDVHLAAGVCVGNVVATTRLIYPQAVGSDIGCGMMALAFDAEADAIRKQRRAEKLLEGLKVAVPTMRHRNLDAAPQMPGALTAMPLSAGLESDARREGRIELGTLGRGNHFVEFQADEEDRLWLMLHSGSRHMGQAINNLHARNGVRAGGGLYHLDSESDAGRAYLGDVEWARAFADSNRRCMLNAIAGTMSELFGIASLPDTWLACDHNHVRRERHGERELWVHRKGAVPAGEGEPGIIPGSMGTGSFHTIGRGCADALHSSSHGAGRAMSRSDARRRIPKRKLIQQLGDVWFDERLAEQLCEEAPSAYKDIDAVFRAQRDLTRIVRRLTPVLVYKGV